MFARGGFWSWSHVTMFAWGASMVIGWAAPTQVTRVVAGVIAAVVAAFALQGITRLAPARPVLQKIVGFGIRALVLLAPVLIAAGAHRLVEH